MKQCEHAETFGSPGTRLCDKDATHVVAGVGAYCQRHADLYAARWTILSHKPYAAVPIS